jgi:hypothetical protein
MAYHCLDWNKPLQEQVIEKWCRSPRLVTKKIAKVMHYSSVEGNVVGIVCLHLCRQSEMCWMFKIWIRDGEETYQTADTMPKELASDHIEIFAMSRQCQELSGQCIQTTSNCTMSPPCVHEKFFLHILLVYAIGMWSCYAENLDHRLFDDWPNHLVIINGILLWQASDQPLLPVWWAVWHWSWTHIQKSTFPSPCSH